MSHPPLLITGATDGIGRAAARQLGEAGLAVVVHGRSRAKAEETVVALRRAFPSGSWEPTWCDFGDLDQVRDWVRGPGQRDWAAVVHNAGVLQSTRTLTADGWETTWQVNVLAPFLIHHGVGPRIVPGGREVWVSSMLHTRGSVPWDDPNGDRGYDGVQAYNNTKLVNAMLALRTARRVPAPTRISLALHPGVIATKVLRSFGMAGGSSPDEGGAVLVKAVTDPSLVGRTGIYWNESREAQASAAARNEDDQDRLWDWLVRSLALG